MTEMPYAEWDRMSRLERVQYLRETHQVWRRFIYTDLKPVALVFEPDERVEVDAWLRDVEVRRLVADERYTALKKGVPYSPVNFQDPPYPFKTKPSVKIPFTPTAAERVNRGNREGDPVFGSLDLRPLD